MPDQISNSLSRGRTQTTKPLVATTASLTAPTASTRAKSKLQVSATGTLTEKRPNGIKPSASSSSVVTPKKKVAPRQGITEKNASETPSKLESQPLKATLNKEPSTEETPLLDSENIPPQPDQGNLFGDKATEQAAVLEPCNIPLPPDSTDFESSTPSELPEPSQTVPPTTDPLQVAAQTYPWLYMSSTLDACFAEAEKTATKQLGELEKEVTEDEAELEEEKLRHESERLIEFCDELGSDTFAKDAPSIMQSFMSFGEKCEHIEAEALQLAMTQPDLYSEEPLQIYQTMMDNLDELQAQAAELESSILRLTKSMTTQPPGTSEYHQGSSTTNEVPVEEKLPEDTVWAKSQIMGVFAASLPVLRARMANLSMAQELIDSAQENFSLALRMESMGIE